MISLGDIKENQLLDIKVYQGIPEKCICGSPIVIDDQMQTIKCSNENCQNNIFRRFRTFIDYLGAEWSDDDIHKIIKERKLVTPFQLFKLPSFIENKHFSTDIIDLSMKLKSVCGPNDKIDIQKGSNQMSVLQSSLLREYRLYQIVEMSGHQKIKPIAKDLFTGFYNMHDAYTHIKLWPVTFVSNRLGLKTTDSLGLAADIYNELLRIENELKFGEQFFTVIKPDTVINLSTSGELDGFINVQEFIDTVQNRYDDRVEINLIPTIYQKIDAYINDYDTYSKSYKRAWDLNEQYLLKQRQNHLINESDIGKIPDDTKFHQIGEKVFIGTANLFIQRLDNIYLKGAV